MMKNWLYLFMIVALGVFVTISCKKDDDDDEIKYRLINGDGVTDIDGNSYKTVIINNREWMAEDLRTTKYQNGESILTALDTADWSSTTSGAYTIFPHEEVDGLGFETDVVNAYGLLYNWYAVADERELCPSGWEVPSDDDWKSLATYIGGEFQAGKRLKSVRTEPDIHPRWDEPNNDVTDVVGFSAIPGGYRFNQNGNFNHLGSYGSWWSSTESTSSNAVGRRMYYNLDKLGVLDNNKRNGFSIRCIKIVEED